MPLARKWDSSFFGDLHRKTLRRARLLQIVVKQFEIAESGMHCGGSLSLTALRPMDFLTFAAFAILYEKHPGRGTDVVQ